MANIRPFRCIRPNKEVVSLVAALPYDVYDRSEAKREVEKNPLSFLAVDRAETQFPDEVEICAPRVYQRAREQLEEWQQEGILIEDETECYYVYELTMNGRAQTGIVACASVDDYRSGVIVRHENTREEKEQDRIRHVDVTDANTGPIFMAYRSDEEIRKLVDCVKKTEMLYDFTAEDGVRHRVWRAECAGADLTARLTECFNRIPKLYIADGHHRAASAVKVAMKRREEHPGYTGKEPFHHFLSVLFPDDELMILPYNRVVNGLNGLSEEEFLKQVEARFEVRLCDGRETGGVVLTERHHMGMYLDGRWYELTVRPESVPEDPVDSLDVSILQNTLLGPVLGIGDVRTDNRIQFVGGIRGTKELERLADASGGAAFLMYPTSIGELFAVADAGRLMPPKSTWFEPKLRSGLFIHKLA